MHTPVREFKDTDTVKVKELIHSILSREYPEDRNAYPETDLDNLSKTYKGARNTFMVAEDSGRIVGTAGIKEDDKNTALLRRLFVDPEYRRKGYGSALIDWAIEFCRKMRYLHIVFRATSRMKGAIELCKKKGFREKEALNLGGFNVYKFVLDLK